MKNIYKPGDVKVYSKIVQPHEIAAFDSGIVHNFYATFYLVKDVEWSTRLFVLDMKEHDEEGIGTFIDIKHIAPAFVGDMIDIYAQITEINKHEIICTIEAKTSGRIIASGRTGQKIMKKEILENRIKQILDKN